MYVRPYKDKFRFAESYADPLTGRKREVSVILDKNTNASRKEAAACMEVKRAYSPAEATQKKLAMNP